MHTTLPSTGNHTLYAPGVCRARPRLRPIHALAAKLDLRTVARGFTA